MPKPIPLLREKVKVKTTTKTEFESELLINRESLIALLRHAGYEVADDAEIGIGLVGQYLCMITEGRPLQVCWTQSVTRVEED